jgi:UDP-N-acetyl-D-glucosamine dehydrogenase
VGLPLARRLAEAGAEVLGFDIDAARVAALAGEGFAATSDLSRLGEPDALVICVPTPLGDDGRTPDLQYVRATAEAIGATLRAGQLVVLESTTYPGTTDEVVRPILEQASGLEAGTEFYLAYSPEREDPGNPEHGIAAVPKVVGADDPESLKRAVALYETVAPSVVPVQSTRAAEACKMVENVYRAVNVALVNELKVAFETMGVDIWQVLDLAATKPFGYQRFDPGPGFGGHCIPIDPFYLAWKAKQSGGETRFIELAGELNTAMAAHVVGRTIAALGDDAGGKQVLLLGVAYKRDVDDPRESPVFPIATGLREEGAELSFHDPHIAEWPAMRHYPGLSLPGIPDLTPELLAAQDAVVIVTDHTSVDYAMVVEHAKLVVDTRNATKGLREGRDNVVMA